MDDGNDDLEECSLFGWEEGTRGRGGEVVRVQCDLDWRCSITALLRIASYHPSFAEAVQSVPVWID